MNLGQKLGEGSFIITEKSPKFEKSSGYGWTTFARFWCCLATIRRAVTSIGVTYGWHNSLGNVCGRARGSGGAFTWRLILHNEGGVSWNKKWRRTRGRRRNKRRRESGLGIGLPLKKKNNWNSLKFKSFFLLGWAITPYSFPTPIL